MRSVGIIPARGGSKGIPRKNVYSIHGKPLIAYTIEAALQSSLDAVYVSSEDDEILDIAGALGATGIRRPDYLARDDSPSLPVIQHVCESIEGPIEYVVTLQPTSPLRTHLHIDEALELFKADSEANSLVSVIQVPHNMIPESIMFIDEETRYLKPFMNAKLYRRQDKNLYYARNGAAIYITKHKNISQYIWGGKILAYQMNEIDSLDIDEENDLKKLLKYLQDK